MFELHNYRRSLRNLYGRDPGLAHPRLNLNDKTLELSCGERNLEQVEDN